MNFLVVLGIALVHRNWFGGNQVYDILPLDKWFTLLHSLITTSPLRFVVAVVFPTMLLLWFSLLIEDWLFGLCYLLLCIFVLLTGIDVLDLDLHKDGLEDEIANQLPYLFFQSIFPSLFWFLILGPVGVCFYILGERYCRYCEDLKLDRPTLEQMLHCMEWIPARLTGFIFALLGEFRGGFGAWIDAFSDLSLSNADFLNIVARASVMLDEGVESYSKEKLDPPPLHWLLEKTVWGWVAFTAVLTVWGW